MSACPKAKIISSRSRGKRIIGLVSVTGLLTLLYLWQLGRRDEISAAQEIMEELVSEKDRSVRVTSPHMYLAKHGGRRKLHSRPWRVLCWITTFPGNFQVQLMSDTVKPLLRSRNINCRNPNQNLLYGDPDIRTAIL